MNGLFVDLLGCVTRDFFGTMKHLLETRGKTGRIDENKISTDRLTMTSQFVKVACADLSKYPMLAMMGGTICLPWGGQDQSTPKPEDCSCLGVFRTPKHESCWGSLHHG